MAEAGSVPPKRICVVGAGSIGGLLGVQLSLRGHTVTFFARGAHLAAMRAASAVELVRLDGTTVSSAPGSIFADSLTELPKQDVVILGLKTHQISSVLSSLPSLLGPDTVILTTQNGIPWWYFQIYGGPPEFRDRVVRSVDPDGALHGGIDPARILAAVVYPAAKISSPGVITHVEGTRFPVGELSGESTPRVAAISAMLVDAGFKSPVLPDVRGELWLKLWGTVAINPLSALTHATLDELCTVPHSRAVVVAMMREVEQVANAVGTTMRLPLERRVDGAARVGAHKTSMLQDAEIGRPMEVDTIMGAVTELARLAYVSTPHVDAIQGTISMLAYVMDKHQAKVPLVPLK